MEKKKILAINCNVGSGGGVVMLSLADVARNNGYDCLTVAPGTKSKKQINGHKVITKHWQHALNIRISRCFGNDTFLPFSETNKLIRLIKKYDPDIIHLHGLHGGYLDYVRLFKFLNKLNVPIIWTQHDCWSFTGGCPCFQIYKCEKWKTGCKNCEFLHEQYPVSKYFDVVHKMWNKKKKAFTLPDLNMTLVCPSQWLAGLVKGSFLKDYPTVVIRNGVDLSTFKPTKSDIREKLLGGAKFLVLAVAHTWTYSKGIDILAEVANRLSDDYRLVVVGTDDTTEKLLPAKVIMIRRTSNRTDLAKIYSACDVFINPTRQEVFGLVNIESIACGTPVIMFNTGGCPEVINTDCGTVVAENTADEMIACIKNICEKTDSQIEKCVRQARKFDMHSAYEEYIRLYENV